jgi:hypothetical protein
MPAITRGLSCEQGEALDETAFALMARSKRAAVMKGKEFGRKEYE